MAQHIHLDDIHALRALYGNVSIKELEQMLRIAKSDLSDVKGMVNCGIMPRSALTEARNDITALESLIRQSKGGLK